MALDLDFPDLDASPSGGAATAENPLESLAVDFDLDDINFPGELAKPETKPVIAIVTPVASIPATPRRQSRAKDGDCLYGDVETVPCPIQMQALGIELIDATQPDTPPEELFSPEEFIKQDLKTCEDWIAKKNPPEPWLDLVDSQERAGKNRTGMFKMIDSKRSERTKNADALEKQIKDLSCNPMTCKIVSMGLAIGDDDVAVSIHKARDEEYNALRNFWNIYEHHRPFVGFNNREFDLMVILFRSLLLGVEIPFTPNRSRYNDSDVLDLMDSLVGYSKKGMGQKQICRLMGIPVAEDHGDGSQVYALVKEDTQESWAKLAKYNRGDVVMLRELHKKTSGYYFT